MIQGVLERVRAKYSDLRRAKSTEEAALQWHRAQALEDVILELEAVKGNGEVAKRQRAERERKEQTDSARKPRRTPAL